MVKYPDTGRSAARLKREIDRLVDRLAKGIGDPTVIGARSTERHYEREDVMAQLTEAPHVYEVVSLHPAILKRYEQQLETIQQALARVSGRATTNARKPRVSLLRRSQSAAIHQHQVRWRSKLKDAFRHYLESGTIQTA